MSARYDGSPGPAAGEARARGQEVRLAVVMTGGASLAVWMGGVAREINLITAARDPDQPSEAVGDEAVGDSAVARFYDRLLAVLDVEVSIDVLSGSSAGGINAVLLGYANVTGADLGVLRDLWLELGSFDALVRDPGEQRFPSLMRGDGAVLPAIRAALDALAPAARTAPARAVRPTSIFVTTTILRGETARLSDALDTTMYDVDHRGLFAFGEDDLLDPQARARLALAARASAAFPGAFEPAFIPVRHTLDEAHPDMAEHVNASRSFFASDGGILVNRPIGPSLQAVFDRPASGQVRRVLAYVVPSPLDPTPGNDGTETGPAARRQPDPRQSDPNVPPGIGATLLGALGAALNQSVATDVRRLRDHNDAVRARRALRRRLMSLAPEGTRLADDGIYDLYRRNVAERTAAMVVTAVLRVVEQRPAASRPPDTASLVRDAAGRTRVEAAATRSAAASLPEHLPGPGEIGGLWRLGRPAVDAVKATVVEMVNEAYVLSPAAADRQALATFARAVHSAVVAPREGDDSLGRTVASSPGNRSVFTTVSRTVDDRLGASLLDVAAEAARRCLRGSSDSGGPNSYSPGDDSGRADLSQAWSTLGAVVLGLRTLLADILGRHDYPAEALPTGGHSEHPDGLTVVQRRALAARTLDAFVRYLPADRDGVLLALLDLHVVEQALHPAGFAEAPVELVQVSADVETALDPSRRLATDKLTGLQLANFGAFAKSSWRASDWMWGRLDGAAWLVRILLDPRRLVTLRDLAAGEAEAAEGGWPARAWLATLTAQLAGLAGTPVPSAVRDELAFLDQPEAAVPRSLPTTATWVAAGVQRQVVAAEVPHVAAAIRRDVAVGVDAKPVAEFLAAADAAAAAAAADTEIRTDAGAAVGHAGTATASDESARLLQSCRVPTESLTDTANTAVLITMLAQLLAVVTAWFATLTVLPRTLRPAAWIARTATRLAYELVHDTTRRRRRGTVAAGGLLLVSGSVAATTSSGVIGALAVAATLAGLVVVGLTSWRRLPVAFAVLGCGVLGVLAAAGFVPVLADWLFPWLSDDAVPYLADHPWAWLAAFSLLLLPSVWSLAEVVFGYRARRRAGR